MPTIEEKRAYSRGYAAASRHAWPEYRPPHPPVEVIAQLMESAKALRDAVDTELAMLDPEDPWQESLGTPMDAVDESMIAVSVWLASGVQA